MPQTLSSPLLTPRMLRRSLPGIGWVATRCLQTPPHPLSCHRCKDACPAGALAFHEDERGIVLQANDACHGCSQCAAACPSEALVDAKISQLIDAQPLGEPQLLGCHRTREAPGMTRLHCLRALGVDLLTWLGMQAMPSQVELRLPESCQGCLAAPMPEAFPDADAWLEQATLLCLVTVTPATTDYQIPVYTQSRRDLLLGRSTPQMPAIAADDSAPQARRLQRRLSAAETLGTTWVAPELILDVEACRAHGVCSRVCPTEALRETPDGKLLFDPQACLDCGHCQTVCPEQALRLDQATAVDAITLRHGQSLECFECQRHFTVNYKEDFATPLCPACRREQALLEESFHELFG